MDDEQLKALWSEFARRGGEARAKKLTAERRKEIATKASRAAAKVRKRNAATRKSKQSRLGAKGKER